MENSKDFYSKFSTYYTNYANSKITYTKAVDEFIVSNSNNNLDIIDIGSGDGYRARGLSKMLGTKKLTLVDDSIGMVKQCKSIGNFDVLCADISNDYFEHNYRYDIAICLWNVLGHIFDSSRRLVALKNMRSLIKDNGSIYLDVNNRYNVSQYGLLSVIRNIYRDIISYSDENGNFSLSMVFGGKTVTTKVHIFSSMEIEKLVKRAGLKIEKRIVINYVTGKSCLTSFGGQLVYKLSKI